MVTQIQTPAGSPVSVGAGSMAMTKMAVPKCQLFARILVIGRGREVALHVMEALLCQDAWGHQLTLFILEQVFVRKCHGANWRPARSQRWNVAKSNFSWADLGAGRPSGPGAGDVSAGRVLPS